MVTGDAVNVAARLEAAAVPGQIVVAERTAASVRGFLFEDLGSLDLKGKARPVRAYALVEAIADAPERGVPGLHAPMIGRDDELALLRAVFERVLGESRPSIVTIYGDAGLGKSRLTAEFLTWAERDRGGAARPAGALPPVRRRHHVLAARRDPEGARGHPRFRWHRRRGREGPQTQPRPAHRRRDARPRSIGRRPRLHDRPRGPGRVVPVAAIPRTSATRCTRRGGSSSRRWRAAGRSIVVIEDIHWADPVLLDLLDELSSRARRADPARVPVATGAHVDPSGVGRRRAQRDRRRARSRSAPTSRSCWCDRC